MSPSQAEAEAEADNHRSPHPFPRLGARREPTRMLRAGGQLTGQWGAHGRYTSFPGKEAGRVQVRPGPCKCETRPAVSGITWDHLSQKREKPSSVSYNKPFRGILIRTNV